MQDDRSRVERYESLATAMRLTAEHVTDEHWRAELLSLANQYEVLAESVRREGSAVP